MKQYKIARRMRPPIGDCHFAAQDECNGAREKAEHQQRAADQFKHPPETRTLRETPAPGVRVAES